MSHRVRPRQDESRGGGAEYSPDDRSNPLSWASSVIWMRMRQGQHTGFSNETASRDRARDAFLSESSVAPIIGPLRLAWLNGVAGSPLLSARLRGRLLRWSGVETGRGCGIWPHVRFVGGRDVKIGNGVFINSGVVFDARARVELGSNVAVGPGALFITSSHRVGPPTHRAGQGTPVFGPIVVEEGCWIGAGAIILAGVTIRRGCVIGAGAVVNRDCEPNGLYVGAPARRQRNLPEADVEPWTALLSHPDH
jgi:maltose O-acetyltransferase